jgi:NADH-quinone oxidoreductase subunit M
VVTILEFLLSAGLWWAFDPTSGGIQFGVVAPWLPQWGINYRVGLDGISLFMVLLSTGLMPLAVLGSWKYITERERGYYALMLTLTTGMLGVFLALDLFVFYVFWEVMLIPMYFIIGVWGGKNRLYAAIKFFIYTFLGSLLMLVAILVMVWKGRREHRNGFVRLRRPAGARATAGNPGSLALRGLLPGVRDQSADVPVPHLATRRSR